MCVLSANWWHTLCDICQHMQSHPAGKPSTFESPPVCSCTSFNRAPFSLSRQSGIRAESAYAGGAGLMVCGPQDITMKTLFEAGDYPGKRPSSISPALLTHAKRPCRLNLSKCRMIMQDEQLTACLESLFFDCLACENPSCTACSSCPLCTHHQFMAKLESSREGHHHTLLVWYNSSTTAFSACKKRSR